MIETARLRLRSWREEDLPVMRGWRADAEIMQHFGATSSADDTDKRFQRMQLWEKTLGFTFWALERKSDGAIIGNCGLKPLTIPWPDADDIEIGWLLAKQAWGQGYALEAATPVLALGLTLAPRVIAMTAQTNAPSWGLMLRLGMTHEPALDFDHPEVPDGIYKPHVVYVKEAA